jgi:hypothetical protein
MSKKRSITGLSSLAPITPPEILVECLENLSRLRIPDSYLSCEFWDNASDGGGLR